MKRTLAFWLLSLFFCLSHSVLAEIPNIRPVATCTRSQSVLKCSDTRGNFYSVFIAGNTLSSAGFDATSRQHWSQTTSRFGNSYFFSGITSGGQIWVGSSRKLGWDVRTRMATSSGDRLRLVCNRLTGCR